LLEKYGKPEIKMEKRENPKWGADGLYSMECEKFYVKIPVRYWYLKCPGCKRSFSREELTTQKNEIPHMNPHWIFFFMATQFLTELGWQELWRSFVAWAYPEVMKAKAVLSNFVTPKLLQEIAEGLSGKQPPKVKEPKIP